MVLGSSSSFPTTAAARKKYPWGLVKFRFRACGCVSLSDSRSNVDELLLSPLVAVRYSKMYRLAPSLGGQETVKESVVASMSTKLIVIGLI